MDNSRSYFLYLPVSLIALAGLLLPVACQATPTPGITPTSTPEPQPTATPEPQLTATPQPQPTATARPQPTDTPAPASPTKSAANADVLFVRAVQSADGAWTFHVTVEHPDTGWEDYADGWDVLTPDDTIIKPDPDSPFTRLLLHPHENEQPFTRSQTGIVIPPDVTQVRVRAHDLVDGYGGREVLVDLTVDSGPDFEVQHSP
jgi:hypothetical protein